MVDNLKGVIWVTTKRFWEALNESLSWEIKNLIVEKDKDVSVKENQSTKRVLKTLLNLNTQRSNKQHYIKSYAPACMHNSIVKPYDEFYFFKKNSMFSWAQKYKINYFSSIFKESKIRVLHFCPNYNTLILLCSKFQIIFWCFRKRKLLFWRP